MLLTVLDAILQLTARPESGGFINTKLNLSTGNVFSADDKVKGKRTFGNL